MVALLLAGHPLRTLRHGQGQGNNEDDDQDNTRMSALWQTVLGILQDIGDRSGCHQLPERSFTIKSYTFPVCARCTGVCLGQIAAIIAFLSGVRADLESCVLLLFIMGLDWLIQQIGWKESTNLRRFVTGICGGFGLFSLYIFIIIRFFKTF